jgi:hypothetical protein
MKNFSAKNAEFETLKINNEAAISSADLGTAPNQIPLNKDLGSLAYQDAVNLDDVSADMLELRGIAAEISDSAVDVFVYDTSRDSDGGAWRKRTQHTSWYNEELNTATRGGRREFPAVAVIVAEIDKVTIYDGDDPDLSMWMVFENLGTFSFVRTSLSSVFASNGQLCIGNNVGLSIARFANDSGYSYFTSERRTWSSVIATRTELKYDGANDTSIVIVNNTINDVAMTILPNAPIDQNTGLPVPTIAVATDGGVSVIKDDGSVTSNNTFGKIQKICITEDYKLYVYRDAFYDYVGTHGAIDGNLIDTYRFDAGAEVLGSGATLHTIDLTSKFNLTNQSNDIVVGQDYGVSKINNTVGDFQKELYNYTTSKYNTGWMPGDTKLATLSDTTVETIGTDSSELVENGDFSTDVTASDGQTDGGWTSQSAVLSVNASQQLVVVDDNNDSVAGRAYQTIQTIPGQKYVAVFDKISTSTVNGNFYISNSTSYGTNLGEVVGVSAGSYSITFTATNALTYIILSCESAAGGAATFDNISVRATTELITNGDFSIDATAANFSTTYPEWTANNAVLSVTGGKLRVDDSANAGTWSSAVQQINLVPGKQYTLSMNTTIVDAGSNYHVGIHSSSSFSGTDIDDRLATDITEYGSYSITFTASTANYLFIGVGGDGVVDFDNISVRPAVEDRSVNGNGLQIIGEINKTPVAPGADLVAYSGFSANNYLVRPYNEDLDFTDTMSIMLWVKDVTGNFNPIDRGTRYIDHSYGLYLKDVDGDIRFYYSVDGTTDQQVEITGGASLIQSGWHHVAVCVSQGKIKMYVDGKLLSTADQVGNFYSQSTNQNGLVVGSGTVNSAYDHPIALLRISATAPTDAQIAKIYHDEKALFTDGAQATLYGTSDAVTALAYDEKTELLHVGTASGRSDFSGLRRINNTTTAITTSISAHNNLIAEQ